MPNGADPCHELANAPIFRVYCETLAAWLDADTRDDAALVRASEALCDEAWLRRCTPEQILQALNRAGLRTDAIARRRETSASGHTRGYTIAVNILLQAYFGEPRRPRLRVEDGGQEG